MEEKQFFKMMRHMGIYPNTRSGYYVTKSLYGQYVKKARFEKIMKDIEESKKGPYYLLDYLMKQKQENIMSRIIIKNMI